MDKHRQAKRGIGKRERLARLSHRLGILPLLTRARSLLRPDLRILAYHRVLDIDDFDAFEFDADLVSATATQFRQQMQLLKRRFRPLAMSELIALLDAGESPPGDSVIVTFDDGYDDNARVALPILRDTGVPATFFISTDHIDSGQPFAYDWLVHMICTTPSARLVIPRLGIDCALEAGRQARRTLAASVLNLLKDRNADEQRDVLAGLEVDLCMPRVAGHPACAPMTWDQVRELHAAGMDIGSHGATHQMLAKMTDAELDGELDASRSAIARETGAPPVSISYPVGGRRAYDARVIERVRAHGFRIGCSYISGTNPARSLDLQELRRLPIEREMGLPGFAALLAMPELFNYPTPAR